MSQPFLNLTPVRSAQLQLRRQQFIHRHIRSGHIALLAFAAGCAFTAIVIAACAWLTR